MPSTPPSISPFFTRRKVSTTALSSRVAEKYNSAKLATTPILLPCNSHDSTTTLDSSISCSSPYFCDEAKTVPPIDLSRFSYVPNASKPKESTKRRVKRDHPQMKMDEENFSIDGRSDNVRRGLHHCTPQSTQRPPSQARKNIYSAVKDIKSELDADRFRTYESSPMTTDIPSTPKRCKTKTTKKDSNEKSSSTTTTTTYQTFSTPKKTTKRKSRTNLPTTTTGTRRIRKRRRIIPGSLPPPAEWERVHALVRELREDGTAPIDSVVCRILADRHKGEKIFRFQNLLALMLSSQTKDAIVGETMRVLRRHGLDRPEAVVATSEGVLNGLIWKVGFHNKKTTYIKKVAEILMEEYGGDIPHTVEGMMKLPGVGPKMAYLVEDFAFGVASGIGVDTHMHRLFNDLKWVKSKTPEQTREQLEGWMPQENWNKMNVLWVGLGQESQQCKERILRKALACSQPFDALKLLERVGVNLIKEGKKYGLEDEIQAALSDERMD